MKMGMEGHAQIQEMDALVLQVMSPASFPLAPDGRSYAC